MAGRGKWGGRNFGGFDRTPNYTPYENFPEVERLPDLTTLISSIKVNKLLAFRQSHLEEFWQGSCYNLQEDSMRTRGSETKRISGKKPKIQERREALASYLKLTTSNFPVELIQGSRRVQQSNKKLKWDRHADQLSLDTFEKLEEKHKDKDKGDKKQDEDEEEDLQEDAEEESSDDDYNQNIDFDDDEDDMNMEEENDDEAVYD